MKRALVCLIMIFAAPLIANAASQRVEDAKRVFGEVSQNPDKLGTYCAMIYTMYAMDGDRSDPTRVEGHRRAFDGLMTTLGPDFRMAWEAGDVVHATDQDAKEYKEASEALESRCPKPAQ